MKLEVVSASGQKMNFVCDSYEKRDVEFPVEDGGTVPAVVLLLRNGENETSITDPKSWKEGE